MHSARESFNRTGLCVFQSPTGPLIGSLPGRHPIPLSERLPEMIRLCASRLQRHGVIAIETPNPECLAIFATHFYLDPTHRRPVPHPLLAFYLDEFGVGRLEVRKLSPAADSMPSV